MLSPTILNWLHYSHIIITKSVGTSPTEMYNSPILFVRAWLPYLFDGVPTLKTKREPYDSYAAPYFAAYCYTCR